jgi:hypothetical protein
MYDVCVYARSYRKATLSLNVPAAQLVHVCCMCLCSVLSQGCSGRKGGSALAELAVAQRPDAHGDRRSVDGGVLRCEVRRDGPQLHMVTAMVKVVVSGRGITVETVVAAVSATLSLVSDLVACQRFCCVGVMVATVVAAVVPVVTTLSGVAAVVAIETRQWCQ